MDVVSALLCLLLSIILIYFNYMRKKLKFPPGPKGYPIIGSTFDVDTTNLHLTLTKWAKEYGDIYRVNLFGNNTIVLNSGDIVREAFTVEPNATLFADRITTFLTDKFLNGHSDILFGSYSAEWMKRRKIGHKILKAYGEGLEAIEKSVHEQLQIAIAKFKMNNNRLFDPEDIINEFLSGIIAILLTGRRHENNSDCIQIIMTYDHYINEIFSPGTMLLFDWLPFIRFIPSPVSRLFNNTKEYQKKFEDLIHTEKDKKGNKGMVHCLYDQLHKNENRDVDEQWLTEGSIFSILTDMIGGGFLTSKGTIWSAINILIHRQDIQKELQTEVDTVVGHSRQPVVADRTQMPYTEAFIIETLRFISHIPLLLPHRVLDDTKLAGYDIEKGSTVLVNSWNIHLNEKLFPEPNQFKPEHFLDNGGALLPANSPQRQNFLSFGVGKRSCIGESFARTRIFLFISTMMQKFTFLSDDSCSEAMLDPSDMEPTLARMPKRFLCRVKLRHEINK